MLRLINGNVCVIGDMAQFENPVASCVASLPGERSFSPVRDQNHSSSGSSRRSGGGRYDDFFGDQVVCPTCRGVGHIPNGLIL